MPNQPDPNKVLVGVRTPRELVAALEQEAREKGLKVPGLIVRILQQYVGDPTKRLSRFELEDLEQEKLAAQEETGSRRSSRSRKHVRRDRYEDELVMGEPQPPVSDAAWRATMNTLAADWHLQDAEDGFYLSSDRVPGCVGIEYREGGYDIFASYMGSGQVADFAKPLKWRYGGTRCYGAWRARLHDPALALNLRPIGEGELISYVRSGKDDALRKLADKLREFIASIKAYHRRVMWCSAVQEVATDGWYVYAEHWRYLCCSRVAADKQVGRVQLRVYEPVENESIRLELQLEPAGNGHLRTLLKAMGRRDLTGKIRAGKVALEEVEMPLLPNGAADEEKCKDRLLPRIVKWMGRVDTCLMQGLPMENFAALAVETSNHDFASICDLGIVIVRRGAVVKSMHYLIRPEENAYLEQFSEWHGITAEDTESAPSFAEIWSQVEPMLRKLPLVVHSGGVAAHLHAAFDKAELARPEFSLLNNLLLARQCFPELQSHSLYEVAAHIGRPITRLGALPKAEACAHIAIELYNKQGESAE